MISDRGEDLSNKWKEYLLQIMTTYNRQKYKEEWNRRIQKEIDKCEESRQICIKETNERYDKKIAELQLDMYPEENDLNLNK